MGKISLARITAILFCLLLVVGAIFSLQRLGEDISTGKYFGSTEELHYDIVFLISYILIIIFIVRYGYYLAINRVNWKTIKDDFLYLLNKKYFSKFQWIINVLLFWLALAAFIYSLIISTLKGKL